MRELDQTDWSFSKAHFDEHDQSVRKGRQEAAAVASKRNRVQQEATNAAVAASQGQELSDFEKQRRANMA